MVGYKFKWALYKKVKDPYIGINSNILSGQLVASNAFSLPKDIKLECAIDYRTPFLNGVYKTQNLFAFNMGISKSFFDNNLKISLVGNDIFRTYTIKNISVIEDQTSKIIQSFDTQWIRLGLVYKFMKGIEKDSDSPNSDIKELKSRAQ